MKRTHELRSQQTIDTIKNLTDKGITKLSVLIRHSDRFYPEKARMEPFMGLTPKGKSFALDMGSQLPHTLAPQLFSSMFGRCIETAYLIDKGFTQSHKTCLAHNNVSEVLTPFYIKDIEKAIHIVQGQGNMGFIRNWHDHKIDDSIMEDPETTADKITGFMLERLQDLNSNEIAVCVSHDWNIFPVKEFKLGLKHETSGDVGYLDGLVFFEQDRQYFITNFQSEPQVIEHA